ncbi:unnamed protein product [Protopolystoma xenopodis]|uniref:Uncharacterized protein n=1 Tax=Protopolystoma xenopodis TaxID=117903 RepID=A0A3S5AGF6_9PLAT|nr:unnamed protein product [Protopolystoma xenopodis]
MTDAVQVTASLKHVIEGEYPLLLVSNCANRVLMMPPCSNRLGEASCSLQLTVLSKGMHSSQSLPGPSRLSLLSSTARRRLISRPCAEWSIVRLMASLHNGRLWLKHRKQIPRNALSPVLRGISKEVIT